MNKLTFREIKNLNTIEIVEDVFAIQFPPADYEAKPVIGEGVIKFTINSSVEEKRIYVHINVSNASIDVYSYSTKDYEFGLVYSLDVLRTREEGKPVFNEVDKSIATLTYNLEVMVSLVANLMSYVSYVVENKKTTIVSNPSSNKNSGGTSKQSFTKKSYSILNADKKIYIYHVNEEPKRKYNKITSSWEVVGHLRHYKSGKVVWIAPYTKGKGKASKKDYKILKNNFQ